MLPAVGSLGEAHSLLHGCAHVQIICGRLALALGAGLLVGFAPALAPLLALGAGLLALVGRLPGVGNLLEGSLALRLGGGAGHGLFEVGLHEDVISAQLSSATGTRGHENLTSAPT